MRTGPSLAAVPVLWWILASGGCVGEEVPPACADPPDWWPDADGDGFGATGAPVRGCRGGAGEVGQTGDCRDDEARVHPGADETCNGSDDDCDGRVDEDAVDGGTFHLDGDGDGWGDPTQTVQACAPGPGAVADATDCDDADPNANPGFVEEYYNGVDDDCDPATVDDDQDRDGYPVEDDCSDVDPERHPGVPETCNGGDDDCDGAIDDNPIDPPTAWLDQDADGYGDAARPSDECGVPPGYVADQSDCDDSLAEISPAALEVCRDGVDNDCDGQIDESVCQGAVFSLPLVAVAYTGELAYDNAASVAAADDVDGDGHPDLLVAAIHNDDAGASSGAAYLVTGSSAPTSVSLSTALELTPSSLPNAQVGVSMAAAGDIDADGYADVVVGSYASAVYLYTGPGLALAAEVSGMNGDYAGGTVAGGGDVNGDGFDDVLVDAVFADDVCPDCGSASLILGSPGLASIPLSSANATFTGDATGELSTGGYGAVAVGDLTGDGYAESVVGAPSNSDIGLGVGAVYIVLGSVAPASAPLSTAVELTGEPSGFLAGMSTATGGDANGDGYGDLLVGAFDAASVTGMAYVVLGARALSSGSLSTAQAELMGAAVNDLSGKSLSFAGDFDADGYDDMVFGASTAGGPAVYTGAAALVLGENTIASESLDAASATLTGSLLDFAGSSVVGAGDIDGDGLDDVLIGALGNDAAGVDAGVAYLVLGGSL
jgi:hypothetical protein